MFFRNDWIEVLRLLDGVHGILDDILTHGETEVQHDGRLLTLLETARMNNLSLNPDNDPVQVYRLQVLWTQIDPRGTQTRS